MLNESDLQDMKPTEQPKPQLVGYMVILPGEPDSNIPEPMIGLYKEPSAAIIKKWKTIGFDYRPIEQTII